MEATCWKGCPLHKKYGDKCPNFVVTTWESSEGRIKDVKDCAPIRTFLMIRDLFNRIVGMEAANNQSRNQLADMVSAIKSSTRLQVVHIPKFDRPKEVKDGSES